MYTVIVAAVAAYIATNIDDLFINMIYFAQADSRKDSFFIYAGKYAGTALLILFSIAGAQGLAVLPQEYIAFLGIIPFSLGVKEAAAIFVKKEEEKTTVCLSGNIIWAVAATTVASGADNIGVYIPLFAGFTTAEAVVTVFIFAVMTAVWCRISSSLVNLPLLKKILTDYKKYIVPVVYIALGIYIFVK